MSDFPRGWTLTTQNAAAAAGITVPGVAGVVHVLDAITAKIFDTAAAQTTVTLTSSDGVFAGVVIGQLDVPAGGSDEISFSGLDLAAGPGASLTVAFGGGGGTATEFLLIQGHDV